MNFLDKLRIQRLLEKKVKQDKDIDDRDGTQPAKYYGKDAEGDEMAKSTKQDRARHFEKGAEKDDNDPSAYKPAPGDATAKTKPSQHTKKFKKMFGEDAQAAAKLKAKQADELERLKDKQADELEALKDRHERQTETQKDKDTVEKENETLQKQRDAERKAAEKEREKAMESLLDTLDTLPDVEDSTHLSELEEGDADKSLEDKAQKSGIAVGILKQVYKRGVAAWRTGHRPGTTPEQWGHARVNSFITGGKTRTTADADLWKQHSGKSEEVEEERDYKKEYENYHSRPEQIKRRAKRNEARRLMKNNKDIKGKDVHHKDNNPLNNDKSNLSIVTQKYNRTEPRLRTEVLDKDATQQDYIDDFLKSDAPQFKGKTKDKIIKMAVAAYNERNK